MDIKRPRSTARDIHAILNASGDTCSYSTVKRALIKTGCKAIKPYRRSNLTAVNAKKRLEWAKQHQNWTTDQWRSVIFSDETQTEVLHDYPRYVRVVDGQPLTPAHYNLTRKQLA